MISQQSASIELNKITPPGPPPLPFVGMLPFLRKHLHLELHKLAKKYGNIYQLNVDGRNVIVLNGLEAIQEALVKQQDCFNSRANFDVYNKPPISHILEFKSGVLWKKHRAIASKVMHSFVRCQSAKLESWVVKEAAELTNIFINFGGKAFDPNLYLPLATLSFMQRLIFNKKGSLKDYQEDTHFVATSYGLRTVIEGSQIATNLEIVPAIWLPILLLSYGKLLFNFVRNRGIAQSYFLKNIIFFTHFIL